MKTNKTPDFESRETWVRTGKTVTEHTEGHRGVITLEEEKSLKSKKTRLVATTYKTIEKKPKGDK